jgi:hypothetical protein
MITNGGTPSKRGVVANDTTHYVLDRDNIYEYKGGRDRTPIGDAIKADWISSVNRDALEYSYLQYLKDDDELRVYVPTGTSTQPDTCYICKVKDNYAWFKDTRAYTSAGKATDSPSGITIGELIGAIGAQNWKIGDLAVKPGATIQLLSDVSGNIVKMNKTLYSLCLSATSTAQSFLFDTKDISSLNDIDPLVRDRLNISEYMDNTTRWIQAKIEAKGQGSMYVAYSIDGGNTFTNFDASPVTLASQWTLYNFDMDRAIPRVTLRITNTGENEVVHIRYIKVQFIPGSEVN